MSGEQVVTPHREIVYEWEAAYAIEYQWAEREVVTLAGRTVETTGWERLEYFDTEESAIESLPAYQGKYRYLRVVKL